MVMYVIRNFQPGDEPDHARIAMEVSKDWIWPYAYDQQDLEKFSSQPDFDPDTRHYCFYQDKMVGVMFTNIFKSKEDNQVQAIIDFPRILPGYQDAADLLLSDAFNTLEKKGVSKVTGRVTTMAPDDIDLAERWGFKIFDWGHKIYYSYKMEWGKLETPENPGQEIDLDHDLKDCAALATNWYSRPASWCQAHLQEWHDFGIITHIGTKQNGKLISSCMAAKNLISPSTAAIYYIFTPDAYSLRSMVPVVIEKCIDAKINNLIVDLVNLQLEFEPEYQKLGFEKVAEWARCEKHLRLN